MYKSHDIIWSLCSNPILSPVNYVPINKSFIISHLEYCCAVWSHRVYHDFNLKLLESTQREVLALVLRSFKLTPMVVSEAELEILPVDIRLQKLMIETIKDK